MDEMSLNSMRGHILSHLKIKMEKEEKSSVLIFGSCFTSIYPGTQCGGTSVLFIAPH